jgi:hypothetical protein
MYLIIVLSINFIATVSLAETIYTKDEKTINARIVDVTKNTIWYETVGGRAGITRDSVSKILNDDGTVSQYSPTNTEFKKEDGEIVMIEQEAAITPVISESDLIQASIDPKAQQEFIAKIRNDPNMSEAEKEQLIADFQKNIFEPMEKLIEPARTEKGKIDIDKFIEGAEKDRILSNEESAATNLRTVCSASNLYYHYYNRYPKNLAELGKQTGSMPPFIDGILATGIRQGYKFEIVDTNNSNFLVTAYPDPSKPTHWSGRYSFCIMKDGIVRVSKEGNPVKSYGDANKLPEYKPEERSVFME